MTCDVSFLGLGWGSCKRGMRTLASFFLVIETWNLGDRREREDYYECGLSLGLDA